MSQRHNYCTSSSTASSPSSSPSHSSLSRIRQHIHTTTNPHYAHRATKAADLAYLLDPSYASPSALSATERHIYVDHDGETHDPDFRLFNYSPKRREFLTVHDASDNDDDEDTQSYDDEQERRRRVSMESYYRPMSRASDPMHYYSESTSPVSYHAHFAVDDGYDSEEDLSEAQQNARRESNKLKRRRASTGEHEQSAQSPTSSTASCDVSYSVRRSWHAFRLRTQVAAFRARKRMLGMVHPVAARRSTF